MDPTQINYIASNVSNITDFASSDMKRNGGFLFRQITPILIVPFGLLGNTMIILVLLQHRYSNISTFFYMKALACCDDLVMLMFGVRWFTYLPNSPINRDRWFCAFYFYFIWLGFGMSAWILLLMAVDRYQLVRKPLEANRYCTVRRAKILLFILIITQLIIQFPHLLRQANPSGNTLQTKCPYTIAENIITPYALTRLILFDRYIPWLLSLVLGVAQTLERQNITEHNQKQQDRRQSSIFPADERSRQVTYMAICTTLVFFIFTFPYSTYWSVQLLTPPKREIISTTHYDLLAYLLYINSAVNFYVYIIVSKSFRRDVKKLFSRKLFCLTTLQEPSMNNNETQVSGV